MEIMKATLKKCPICKKEVETPAGCGIFECFDNGWFHTFTIDPDAKTIKKQ